MLPSKEAALLLCEPRGPKAIFYLADQAGLEGIVSKRADSKDRSGPTANWLKIKSWTVDEFELMGVEREPGKAAFALLAEPGTGKYVVRRSSPWAAT
ncbi:hypothetical protein MES5069_160052 [Mesorhizobium escarrei]|uniref:ATP-dependent DNA ligase family profile domain-containing protein n=2 Tax=Mesorhizobium escarrei TaxID=666018 RepID=A0ABN8JG18_9HYPH|nr:hypothetical protein MES5069_160052 [Mesorhizobium escarrei]